VHAWCLEVSPIRNRIISFAFHHLSCFRSGFMYVGSLRERDQGAIRRCICICSCTVMNRLSLWKLINLLVIGDLTSTSEKLLGAFPERVRVILRGKFSRQELPSKMFIRHSTRRVDWEVSFEPVNFVKQMPFVPDMEQSLLCDADA
jgi:hypothetical protein